MGGSDRWAERFRARLDEAAAARAGSPAELRQRELSASTFFVWVGVGSLLVVSVVALIGDIGWCAPALMALSTALSVRQWHRLRRRGMPRPPTDP